MEVKIDKAFQKDTKRIKEKAILAKIANSIVDAKLANNLSQISNLKKLKGTANLYRIKIGDYRLGVIISKTTIKFIRCLHRKDIYKYFPR